MTSSLSLQLAEQVSTRTALAQRLFLLGGSFEGIPLYGQQADVDLWLPPAAGNTFRTTELATQTIQVPAGRPLDVELKVQPPPPTEDLGKD